MSVWSTKKMAEVTRLVTDGKHGDCEDEADSGYYFLSSKDLRNGALQYDDPRQISRAGFLETHRRTNLEPGDILLTNCGASIGRVGVAQDDPRVRFTTFQKSVSVVKPDPEVVDGAFLYYFFLGSRDLLIQLGGGTAQPNLLIGDIKRIEVPVPPRDVQRQIARILLPYDRLVANNIRRIELLQKMARCVYNECLTKNAAMDCPGQVRHISELCDFVKGKEPGRANYQNSPSPHAVPFLRVGDLSKRRSEIYVDRALVGQSVLVERDVAISLDGTIGIVRHGLAGAYSSGIRKVVPLDKSIGRGFLYQYLQSESTQEVIRAHANGATILHAGSSIKHMYITVPPQEIMEQFESCVEPMMDLMVVLERKNVHLEATRDLLLPKLISGELDVSAMPEAEAIAA